MYVKKSKTTLAHYLYRTFFTTSIATQEVMYLVLCTHMHMLKCVSILLRLFAKYFLLKQFVFSWMF